MGLQVGIVGLPNVGKSTLFNGVSSATAQAANYPFATIEPNVGVVAVPDKRLDTLARLANSAKVVPTAVEFVDIAGLVKGASKGEGLGNQFLARIREVDAIAHVVRCFADDDIIHVDGSVNPARDIEVIETELLLADLQAVEKRADRAAKAARTGDRESKDVAAALAALQTHLNEGQPARTFAAEGLPADLALMTAKPQLYVANVAEGDLGQPETAYVAAVRDIAASAGAEVVVVSAETEAQIAELPPEDRSEFIAELGLEQPGLDRLVTAAYGLLGLITFFTAGPMEARAWTIRSGTAAPVAAGQIHSDIQRGFIRAEVISFDDYARLGGEHGAREAGRLRVEGRDYLMMDGDVVHFRFNV